MEVTIQAKHECHQCMLHRLEYLASDPKTGIPWFVCDNCGTWHNGKGCCEISMPC